MTEEAGQTMYPKLMRDIKHTAKKVLTRTHTHTCIYIYIYIYVYIYIYIYLGASVTLFVRALVLSLALFPAGFGVW